MQTIQSLALRIVALLLTGASLSLLAQSNGDYYRGTPWGQGSSGNPSGNSGGNRGQQQFQQQQRAIEGLGQGITSALQTLFTPRQSAGDDLDEADETPILVDPPQGVASSGGSVQEGEQFLQQLRQYLASEQARLNQGLAQGQDVSLLRQNIANIQQTIAAAEQRLASLPGAGSGANLSPQPPGSLPARPLFNESLSSFVSQSGASGGASGSYSGGAGSSGVASRPDSLSAFLDTGSTSAAAAASGQNHAPKAGAPTAAAQPDYSISPELDRFVREDISWQHAHFDDLARKSNQSASGWQEAELSPSLAESAKSLLRDLRGEQVADALKDVPSRVVGRYQPEATEQALATLEGTKLEFLTYGRKATDPSSYRTESFARDLQSVGGASKELRYKLLGDLAENHKEDTMGTAPLLSSWMEYGETVASEAGTGSWKLPSIKDAGGKVRTAWNAFLDENLSFADPNKR